MAWEDELFAFLDDLEQQAEALYDADRAPELADRSRAAYREVTLASRLMASAGAEVGLEVPGVGILTGTLERCAATWCLLRGSGQDWLVPLAAVATVRGASTRSVPEAAWPAVTQLGIGSALRRLADAGERCVLHLDDERLLDGTVARVGADFLELRTGEPAQQVLVATAALRAVQSRD